MQKVFVKPVFQGDSIQYALEKLLVKVKHKFQDCDSDNFAKNFSDLQVNYQPTGRGSHISDLCEGCQKGLCNSKATIHGDQSTRDSTFYRESSNANADAMDIYVKWKIKI